MKHLFYCTASILMLSILLVSCNSSNTNDELDKDMKIQKNSEVSMDEQRKMNNDFREFKQRAILKIEENERKIDQEIADVEKSTNKIKDDAREKRVMILKKRNTELKNRLDRYNMNASDWERFKNDFNSDMANIGDSFEDLFSKN